LNASAGFVLAPQLHGASLRKISTSKKFFADAGLRMSREYRGTALPPN